MNMVEKESESYLVSEINLAAGFGARDIMQKIGTSSLGEKLLLRNDKILEEAWYEQYLLNRLEFFSLEENMIEVVEILENLFSLEVSDSEEEVILYKKQEHLWKIGEENPRISLRIKGSSFQIPFELEIIPYRGNSGHVREKEFQENSQINYYMFTTEEYLSRSFYEIISHLEVIDSLSWYKEIYDIITNEIVEGRKVYQSFRELLIEDPIPSLECRLDSIRNYENYKYMKKKWKKQAERGKGPYPKWNQMIQLLVKFFEPILNTIQEDEIFVGDWMPQIARYLD